MQTCRHKNDLVEKSHASPVSIASTENPSRRRRRDHTAALGRERGKTGSAVCGMGRGVSQDGDSDCGAGMSVSMATGLVLS
jgi:hypothetical protein